MAIIKTNAVIKDLRGKFGNMVVCPHPHAPDTFILRVHPKPRRKPPGEAELRSREDFTAAVRYAQGIWAEHPEIKAIYQRLARMAHRDAFRLAESDYRHPPQVMDVDLESYAGKTGEKIHIWAVDDCEVVRVGVKIRSLGGDLLEEGAAVLENAEGGRWAYTAQRDMAEGQVVVIEVAAIDRPGNTTVKRVDHSCGPRAW